MCSLPLSRAPLIPSSESVNGATAIKLNLHVDFVQQQQQKYNPKIKNKKVILKALRSVESHHTI